MSESPELDALDDIINQVATLSLAPTADPIDTTVDDIVKHIAENTDTRVILLRNKEVVQWLFGDLSFLPPLPETVEQNQSTTDQTKARKVLEDRWGQTTMRLRRPDLKLDKQWTNRFGEYIAEEIYVLLGKTVSKPKKQKNYQPDIETEESIVEVKTGTFYTTGTAGEKIMGTPFKYAEIPDLYEKPLKILCIGGAEKACREQYGLLPGDMCVPQKQRFLNFCREWLYEYVAATELLILLCNSNRIAPENFV